MTGHGAGGVDAGRRRRLVALLDGEDPRPPTPVPPTSAPATPAPMTPTAARPVRSVPASDEGAHPVHDRVARLCRMAVDLIGVDGAGITVLASLESGREGTRDQVCASGSLTGRLEELQLTVGEGPCLDAYASGAPVLVGDLAAETGRWLGFGPEAVAAGAAAVFSLPLQVGAVRLGALDLHRTTAGDLKPEQLADALALASLATETLLELAESELERDLDADAVVPHDAADGDHGDEGDRAGPEGLAPLLETRWLPDAHADVHVASGMVAVRAGVALRTALLRIRGYAFTHGESIHQVARRVIARELDLSDPPDQHRDDGHDGHDGPDSPPAPDPETT